MIKMKKVWMKLETEKGYVPYYNLIDLEDDMYKLLEKGSLDVKFGQGNHYYIDNEDSIGLVMDAIKYYMA